MNTSDIRCGHTPFFKDSKTRLIELAYTVFVNNGDGTFTCKKTRFGDLILDAKYSEPFVKAYASENTDVYIKR